MKSSVCRKYSLSGLALLVLLARPSSAANTSMSDDFKRIMEWQSLEMAQGLAFNAGSTFDPPLEVKGGRLQPDISLGVGVMPLDKSKFPEMKSKTLSDRGMSNMFQPRTVFPNFTTHLRAGLPWRSDMSLRFTDMTTPPNYKISPGVSGSAQSNTFGIGLRKHFLGDDGMLFTVGGNYNYVFGRVKYNTKFNVDAVEGFSADNDVNGSIQWNLNSFGVNMVLSQTLGAWTPFAGLGYNYATGSVRARLEVLSNTPLIAPIIGEASQHPESNQARYILGVQMSRSWVNFFANAEIKAMGAHLGDSWIVHTGLLLPFRFGPGPSSKRSDLAAGTPVTPLRKGAEKRSPPRQAMIIDDDSDDWTSPGAVFRDAPRDRPARAKKAKPAQPAKPFVLDEEQEISPTLIFIQ